MTKTRGNNPGTTRDAQTRPNPPRLWWLKHLSLAGLFLIVALAALRWWWGHEAQRRMDAMIAAAHAKGEPILPEDFDFPPVPDAENAAIPLKQAEAGINPRGKEWAFADGLSEIKPPLSQADVTHIQAAMQIHSSELQLVRSARGRTKVDWGFRFSRSEDYWFSRAVVDFGPEQRLAALLYWSALAEQAAGHDSQSIEYTRDLLFLARVDAKRAPFLLGALVNQGIQAVGIQSARQQAIDLKLSDSPSPATEEQVRVLIAELLDDSWFAEMESRAFLGQRAFALARPAVDAQAQLPLKPLANLSLPVYQLSEADVAYQLSRAAEAALEPSYPSALSKLPPQSSERSGSGLEYLSKGGDTPLEAPEIRRPVEKQFWAVTERRAAAVMLALRLYCDKHQGRLPATLGDLVPDYLKALPADPFAADGRSFGYLPMRQPPAIYSVGENGKDEGGSEPPRRQRSSTRQPDAPDAVFPLRPDGPAEIPDTQ
jgi:hypothetical protein